MSKQSYKAVFFDLDHTLWDYHRNSQETLSFLFERDLPENGSSIQEMIDIFVGYNDQTWAEYHRGEIKQSEIRALRFKRFLDHFGWYSEELAEQFSNNYVELGPKQKHLLPGTLEILDYLKQNYRLSIITNGFEEIQHQKVQNSGLTSYFEEIITSEKVGIKKPDRGIFEYALNQFDVTPEEAIMIGDNLNTDIQGALNAGIDAVYFDPENATGESNATHAISSLLELKNIL